MSVPRTRIGDVLELLRSPVDIQATRRYSQIGVRGFGRGIFEYDLVSGSELGKLRYFEVEPNRLIVSNIKGWEGAVAVTHESEQGRIASNRFLTYAASADVDLGYISHWLLAEPGIYQLGRASPGSADRNRTLSIKNFEAIQVPLPKIDEQRRIAAHLSSIGAQSESLARVSALDEKSLVGLLPRLVADRLRYESLPTVRLRELCSSKNRIIHPADDRGGATEFVGLEHVVSHTGRSTGGRPLGDEKGRKLQFRSGEVTYGYLRPYLNKSWVADRTGLCSVEQYVLVPQDGVEPTLLGFLLRSATVLDASVVATHNLQLPRVRLERLMSIEVPDIRGVVDQQSLLGQLDSLRLLVERVAAGVRKARLLSEGLLPAARNEIFSAMR